MPKSVSIVGVPKIIVGTLLFVTPFAASAQAIELQRQIADVRTYLESASSSVRNRRRRRFWMLAEKWRADTQWLSSTSEIAMHPAYQSIIGMGPEAIPMIIDDLHYNSGHWYWALKAISNEDPVPPSDRGVVNRMKAAWLSWAKQKGIASQ